MTSKYVLMVLAVLSACAQAQVSVPGKSGVLEYANGVENVYRSLRFKRPDGTEFTPFDDGLKFYKLGANSLSPDRQYSIVNFSSEGDLADSSSVSVYSQYMCAFVRMKDGCIVHVAQDAVCGGEWQPPHQWSINIEPIFANPPNAADTYAAYTSKYKSGSQVSQPKITAYLAEGTTFDNVLACDPPNADNKNVYLKLFAKLQRDGDTQNAARLKRILSRDRDDTPIHVVPAGPDAWVAHVVISRKAYLYAEPEKTSVTKAYLVEGDSVLVNESSLSRGFVPSRYRQKNGNILERWIRCADVNACPIGN